jgi:hypothetical protein
VTDPETGVPISSARVKLAGVDRRLLAYAKRNGLVVTAGTNGKHNPGSKHPQGKAIDFRTKEMSEEVWGHLERDAEQHGLILRDERIRPPGQQVWSAPHGHCEVP